MFKVGDEVLVKGSIVEIENDEYDACPVAVGFDKGRTEWYAEEELIPADKTYESGLEDAWELAKKISNMKLDVAVEVFDCTKLFDVIDKFNPQEALAKIEAYEKEKEIKVGDEVVRDGDEEKTVFIVTRICGSFISGFDKDGKTHSYIFPNRFIQKTGKHIDIESLLRQIGE